MTRVLKAGEILTAFNLDITYLGNGKFKEIKSEHLHVVPHRIYFYDEDEDEWYRVGYYKKEFHAIKTDKLDRDLWFALETLYLNFRSDFSDMIKFHWAFCKTGEDDCIMCQFADNLGYDEKKAWKGSV